MKELHPKFRAEMHPYYLQWNLCGKTGEELEFTLFGTTRVIQCTTNIRLIRFASVPTKGFEIFLILVLRSYVAKPACFWTGLYFIWIESSSFQYFPRSTQKLLILKSSTPRLNFQSQTLRIWKLIFERNIFFKNRILKKQKFQKIMIRKKII